MVRDRIGKVQPGDSPQVVLGEHRVRAPVVSDSVEIERAPTAARIGPPGLHAAVLARLKAAQHMACGEYLIAPGDWTSLPRPGCEADHLGGEVD
jgi:hypothetical protein